MNADLAPLDAWTVASLAALLDACTHGSRVRWLPDPDSEVRTAVARRIAPFDGDTRHDLPDIRQQWLHLSGAVEHWMPVAEAIRLLRTSNLFIDRRSQSQPPAYGASPLAS